MNRVNTFFHLAFWGLLLGAYSVSAEDLAVAEDLAPAPSVSSRVDGTHRGFKHLSLSYQYVYVDGFESSIGRLEIGKTDTHTLNVEIDYALNRRWSISAGIPLIRKRYRGTQGHNPQDLVPVRDDDFIDNGEFHTSFQDFQLGLHYKMDPIGPVTLAPFVAYHVPSHNYPHFAHSAVGQNLWKVEFGLKLNYRPYFSDYYVYFDPSYSVVEETLGVSVNHWRVHTGVGVYLGRSFVARGFAYIKQGKGLEAPKDFPLPWTDEAWYQHDRMLRHNYINVGLGLDWAIDNKRSLSLSMFRMVHAEQSHIMEFALSVGLGIRF